MCASNIQFLFIVTILVTRVASQLYPYNANVFNGCDYFETIELGRVYDVFSPYYPEKYPPGTNCRWSGCAPYGTNIVIKCTDMRIPSYGSCDLGDRLEISYQGCQELNDAMKFCSQSFVTETRSNALVMALRSFPNTTGGSFFCQIHAQQTALPAMQPVSSTRFVPGPSFPQRTYVPAQPQRSPQYVSSYQPGYQTIQQSSRFDPIYPPPAVRYDQGFPQQGGRFEQNYPASNQQPYYTQSIQTTQTRFPQSQPVYQPAQQPQSHQHSQTVYVQPGYQQTVYDSKLSYPVRPIVPAQSYPVQTFPSTPSYTPTQHPYQPTGPQSQAQCQCGLRKKPRIMNGDSIDIEQMPFVCGLIDLSLKTVFCECTIISSNFVVTVAHCLVNRTISNVGVIVGTTDYARPTESRYAATYRLSGAIMHPDYDSLSMLNDIAIAKTAQPIEFNPAVAAACLPISERLSQQTYAYSPVEVGGWGETKQSGPVSTRLQAVTLNVITNEQCNDNYPYRITASQMCCLTPDRKDTCNGDDGAGLCHVDTVTGRLVLVGMPSYGVGCGTRQPRVACRISSYIKWILSTTNENYCVI